ncbi:hypothetical protein TNCV_4281231 [Trichonephila clavipes]|nr:hypothetical protein TNCV_4281231 [Trichonephila clavipes]
MQNNKLCLSLRTDDRNGTVYVGQRNAFSGSGKTLGIYTFHRQTQDYTLEWFRMSGDLETATAGSHVVQSGRPIFDDFFQHLWPYIGNNTANVVFQMVKRLWLIRIDQ